MLPAFARSAQRKLLPGVEHWNPGGAPADALDTTSSAQVPAAAATAKRTTSRFMPSPFPVPAAAPGTMTIGLVVRPRADEVKRTSRSGAVRLRHRVVVERLVEDALLHAGVASNVP